VLNTNVVSAILVTQTFFPLLMKAKGAVVNIGSVAPMTISAYAGLYSGSKAALEILSHQMRMEFEPFGVDVVHVGCPGAPSPNYQFISISSNCYPLPRRGGALLKL
jgi:1-acylglycerone phosphate reductase